MTTWQYNVITDLRDNDALADRLNELGAEGWELVGVTAGTHNAGGLGMDVPVTSAFFKRPAD